jgi:hypothetical protein
MHISGLGWRTCFSSTSKVFMGNFKVTNKEGGGGGGRGGCSQCITITFPWGCQRVPQVPKLFLKTFLIAPHIYPIWFAQSSTLLMGLFSPPPFYCFLPKFNSHVPTILDGWRITFNLCEIVILTFKICSHLKVVTWLNHSYDNVVHIWCCWWVDRWHVSPSWHVNIIVTLSDKENVKNKEQW